MYFRTKVSPRKRLENVCMDEYVCVGYVSGNKMSAWRSWAVKPASEERKRLYGRVSLFGLCQWKKNFGVNGLVLGRVIGKKTSL